MKNSLHIPALEGGIPVRSQYLPYSKQSIDDTDKAAILAVLNSDFLTTGPMIEKFERKVADYVGSKFAVAFANGTAALHAACYVAGIGMGDEVITTPLTFAATANAILYNGAKPIFADIDPNTCNIDPFHIERLITKQTKAIIPVDYAGQPADYDEIRHFANKYNLLVIEDAAHAMGASYKGDKIGSFSDMTMFSFHPVKPMTTGEGGMITTNNEKYAIKLKQFRTHGITKDAARWINKSITSPWYSEMQFLGFNYRMTDIQAALGLNQLYRLEKFHKRRIEIAKRYDAMFKILPSIITPQITSHCQSSWHLYVMRIVPEYWSVDREIIFKAFQAENVGVQIHYLPVYLHPYYRELGYQPGLCPIAEKTYEQIISLPLFPAMKDEDVEDVIQVVNKIARYYLK